MDNISRYKKETRRKGREKCRPYIENRYNAKNALRSDITKISRKITTRKIENHEKYGRVRRAKIIYIKISGKF